MSDGSEVSGNPAGESGQVETGGVAPVESGQVETGGEPWFSGVSEEVRGWMQNRGYDKLTNPAEAALQAIEGHRNIEKLIGAEKAGNTVVVPSPDAEPEALAEFYNRLGRPKEPDGYDFGEFQPAVEGEDQWLRETMHKHGITANQAKGILADLQQYRAEVGENFSAKSEEQLEADMQTLQKEWGQAFEKNQALARGVVQQLGWGDDVVEGLIDGLGPAGALRLLNDLGSRMGEDSFVSSTSQGFGDVVTPQQASAEIAELMRDKDFGERLASGDRDAVAKWNRLNQAAYGA